MWSIPESKGMSRPSVTEAERLKLISEGCNPKSVSVIVFFLVLKFVHEFCSELVFFMF